MEQDAVMTIGVFARRSRLSQKALRIYDAHGVLIPASVGAADPGVEAVRIAEATRLS